MGAACRLLPALASTRLSGVSGACCCPPGTCPLLPAHCCTPSVPSSRHAPHACCRKTTTCPTPLVYADAISWSEYSRRVGCGPTVLSMLYDRVLDEALLVSWGRHIWVVGG